MQAHLAKAARRSRVKVNEINLKTTRIIGEVRN